MMTNLIPARACTAIATVLLCGAAVVPTIATAAERSLGYNAAATCAALSDAGSGAIKIDAAALTEPKPLTVAPGGPTPAARINPATPQFCRVLGHIDPTDPKAPPIRFQLNLPLQWNGRSVQYGGGGFNGTVISGLSLPPAAPFGSASPLATGFATYGTDSGHETKPGEPPQLFAANDEAFVNFAHASYKKVRDAAVMLIERAYGARPERMYFVGSSEGGREGLTMAQRYPNDFDGIFARVPVINWVGLQHAGTRAGLATMGGGWIRPDQVKLVHDAVLAACDAQDGVADALVEDAVGCKARFDPAKLLCGNGPGGMNASMRRKSQPFARCTRRINFHSRSPTASANIRAGAFPARRPNPMAPPADGARGGWARHLPRCRRSPITALPGCTAGAPLRTSSRAIRISMFANTGRRISPSGCARSPR